MDQDSAFMSMLMNYLFKRLNIKIKTVALYKPSILTSRAWNKFTIDNLSKHLTEQGQMWSKFLV